MVPNEDMGMSCCQREAGLVSIRSVLKHLCCPLEAQCINTSWTSSRNCWGFNHAEPWVDVLSFPETNSQGPLEFSRRSTRSEGSRGESHSHRKWNAFETGSTCLTCMLHIRVLLEISIFTSIWQGVYWCDQPRWMPRSNGKSSLELHLVCWCSLQLQQQPPPPPPQQLLLLVSVSMVPLLLFLLWRFSSVEGKGEHSSDIPCLESKHKH